MKLSSRVSFYRTIIPKIARVLACCEFEDSRRRKNIYENIYIRKIFILSRINYYSNGKIDSFSPNTFRRFVADAKWTSIKKKKLSNFNVTIRINSLFIKAIILVFKGEKKKYISSMMILNRRNANKGKERRLFSKAVRTALYRSRNSIETSCSRRVSFLPRRIIARKSRHFVDSWKNLS